MRVLRMLSVLFFGAVLIVPAIASAATETKLNTLTIQAHVMSVHSVVVDDQDRIVDVFSNTPDATDSIVVYRNEVDVSKIISITPAIQAQYQRLVGDKQGIGILYDHSTLGQVLPTADNQPLYLRLL